MTPQKKEENVNYKKLLLKTIVGLIGVTLIFIIVSLLFKEKLLFFSKTFVDSYGVFAVFSAFLVTGICPIPLPDHAVSAFAMIGGLNLMLNIGISTLGSLLGGIIAYYLGGLLKNTKLYNTLMKRYKKQAYYLINTYGVKGLAIVALTPIPDSPISWLCGALDLPFKKFFWVYLICRFIKITYFLWFIKMGLLAL